MFTRLLPPFFVASMAANARKTSLNGRRQSWLPAMSIAPSRAPWLHSSQIFDIAWNSCR